MMKSIYIFLILLSTLTIMSSILASDTAQPLLSELAGASEEYEGKRLTLILKFKTVDHIFSKIYFYDRKNIDIVFDIAIQTGMEEYKNEILNLREGMDYSVTFLFDGIGNIGLIKGELIRFTPVILSKLPRTQ